MTGLLRELVRRDFEARYAGSALGFAWSAVQPLWLLGLYTVVFSLILRIPIGDNARPGEFALFLFAGLLSWTAVQDGVSRATTAITDGAVLLKKSRLPARLLVLAPIASGVIHQGIATVLFLMVLAVQGRLPGVRLFWLAPALLQQVALTVGLSLLLAGLHVFLRDLAQVVPLILSAWFYLTPVVYPPEMVPDSLQAWSQANPLSTIVALQRAAFLGRPAPSAAEILLATLWIAAVLALGAWCFRRLRPSFVDQI